jgi:diacylglycerol kinase family enzyme
LQGEDSCKVDIGKAVFQNRQHQTETRYFINASNLGIGAEVVNRVNQRSKILGSKLTYFKGTMSTILHYKNIPVSMKLDDQQVLEGLFCGLVICNGQYIGGGMKIAPHADLTDGLFDLIVIKDISKLTLFSKLPLIYKGKHIDLPEIAVYRCRGISMETPDSTIVETDGEIIGSSPREFRILPGCLKLRI